MIKEFNSQNDLSLIQNNNIFDVIILGKYEKDEKLISKVFPAILNDSKLKHKFINGFDLYIKAHIDFPKDFMNIYYPELMDKIMKTDILILVYNLSDKLSFEYLKRFYYLYYKEFDEIDKPKSIIILEREISNNDEMNFEEKVDIKSVEEITNLYSGYFCDIETNEESLNKKLFECLNKLLKMYNYNDDYTIFKYKNLDNEIKIYISIFGSKEIQKLFLDKFLNAKLDIKYKKVKNLYEIKYEKIINRNKFSFKLILKLMEQDNYSDSECNILLYDINNNESYNLIRNITREIILNNRIKFKKIYNLFSFNSNPNKLTIEEQEDVSETEAATDDKDVAGTNADQIPET